MTPRKISAIAPEDKRARLFLPKAKSNLSEEDIFCFLRNIKVEMKEIYFSQEELVLLEDALYGEFFDTLRRSFFLYHFLPHWKVAIRALFQDNDSRPKIVELGCGSGTSSLLFALLGAEVIGIELNPGLVEICKKRKEFYEKRLKALNAEFYQADTFDFLFQRQEPIDAFFSLFAFNLMKPPDRLLKRIIPSLKLNGKIVIVDGNSASFYNRLLPSRRRKGILSPFKLQKQLELLGCRVSLIETHCGIPPFVFRSERVEMLVRKMENTLKRLGLHQFIGISFVLVAEKN